MEEEKEKAMNLLNVDGDADITALKSVPELPITYMEQLPSGFKGYPKGTQIGFTPVTLDELEILNAENENGEMEDEELTNLILAYLLRSIHCNTLNPEDLYYWDVMYIGIQRKLQAFGGTKGTVYGRCPKCGNVITKTFDYRELGFKELNVPALPMKIKIAGRDVEFGQITVKDFLEINTEEGQLGVYARMIKNMEFDEAYNFVKGLYGVDIKKIKFVDSQLNYGLKPFEVTCDNTYEIDNPTFNPEEPISETNPKKKLETCGEKSMLEVTSVFEVVFHQTEEREAGDMGFEVQYG